MRSREELLILLEGWVDRLETITNHLSHDDLWDVYLDMADVWTAEQGKADAEP